MMWLNVPTVEPSLYYGNSGGADLICHLSLRCIVSQRVSVRRNPIVMDVFRFLSVSFYEKELQ